MYTFWKLLHLLAMVLFLGNIITGLFWHRHALRTMNRQLLAFTMDGIIRSDRWMTVPAVVILTGAGIASAVAGSLPLLRTGWIFWSAVALTLSGIIFGLFLAPLQRQMRAMAAADGAFDAAQYRRLNLRWELWGGVATALPLAAVVLMVTKPTL